MASSSDQPQPSSPATTGIQTPSGIPAPAETTSLPLPPAPKVPPLDVARFVRQRGWLDAALVGVVLLFAFLIASFPAANPDFFAQAATGRLILQGKYQFGVDPFVYSADQSDYFVNHSWLFDVLMYGLYQIPTIGGAVVVIFKALLLAALAEILLRAGRRAGQSLWIPAVCIALAILVLSPRLLLRSTCASFLFLGATIWLLTAERPSGKRLWWLLPPLFVLWVNCDAWFFLGPLTVALYLAGEWLQQGLSANETPEQPAAASGAASAPRENDARGANATPLAAGFVVLVVGVAACLVNPHHIHAFALPPELGFAPAGDLIENDPQFHSLFFSPLRGDYYKPYLGLNAAGLAYWPLLLLSLASFVFVFGQVPWWRLAVWMGFALLSLYNVRAIPFFAIVAGPIMALNWQDYAAQLFGPARPLTTAWRNGMLGGRAVSLLLGLALLIVTTTGWLQNQPQLRRLGWGVLVDPSLKAMADTINGWRATGRLGSEEPHWFNMHTEIANYLAYFAPGERVYVDQGIWYFRQAAEDYETIRQGLRQMVRQSTEPEVEPAARKDWRKIFRDRRIRYWIFDNYFEGLGDYKSELVSRLLLFSVPKEWVLCHLDGRIAIFAWRDPQQPETADPSDGLALDLKRLAFGSKAAMAPPRGPEPIPPREWWDVGREVLWPPNPPRSIDAESAALYEIRFLTVEERQEVDKHSRAWRHGIAASTVAGALSPSPVPNNWLSLNWAWAYKELFPAGALEPVRQARKSEELAARAWAAYVNSQFFETPSLYLTIRACRRALLTNPEDGVTYFRLGQAYQRLRNLPQERNFRSAVQLLGAFRSTQMAGAFQNALRFPLDDDKAAQAHEALLDLYGRQLGYIDSTTLHLREALSKRMVAGPQAGTSITEHNQKLDRMAEQLSKLESELENRMARYNLNAASKAGLEKIKVALQEGLSEKALEIIKDEVFDSSNPTELALAKQVWRVALDLGRLDDARYLMLEPEGQPVDPEDLSLYLRLAAARGDYAEADQLLVHALRRDWQREHGHPDANVPIALLVGKAMLGEAQRLTGTPCMPWVLNRLEETFFRPQLGQNPTDYWVRRWRLEAMIGGMKIAQQNAEWNLLRGWFALEYGHCAESRQHFQAARAFAVPSENWAPEVNRLNEDGKRPLWLFPQEEINRLQQLGLQHSVIDALSKQYLAWLVEAQ